MPKLEPPKGCIEGFSNEFNMPMVIVELSTEPQEVIDFAIEIDAITPDGLICARIARELNPLVRDVALFTEDELYSVIEDIEQEQEDVEIEEAKKPDEDDEWE